jgi:hypothetical protein
VTEQTITPRAKLEAVAKWLGEREGVPVDIGVVRSWVAEQSDPTLGRDLLLDVIRDESESARKIAERRACPLWHVWDAALWALATKHDLDPDALKTMTVSIEGDPPPDGLRMSRNAEDMVVWQQEGEGGKLPAARKLLKRLNECLEPASELLGEAWADDTETWRLLCGGLPVEDQSDWEERIRWVASVAEAAREASEYQASGRTVVSSARARQAAEDASALWERHGRTPSVRREAGAEQEPFYVFAARWMGLLGIEKPSSALKAVQKARLAAGRDGRKKNR